MTLDSASIEIPVRVVAFSGSLRHGSVTLLATAETLRGARVAGAKIELVDLRALTLPFRDAADPSEAVAAQIEKLRSALRAADGIVIGSPEYHGSFSGALKNALDLLDEDVFAGKVVGLIAVAGGGGQGSALSHLRAVMRALRAWVVPQEVVIPHGQDAFGEDRRPKDPKLAARLADLGIDVARFARLHRDARQKQAGGRVG